MKKKFFYYLKKYKIIFFVITLILALVGSYQFHYHNYTSKWKAVQVIIYSTVKLFAFSPTSAVTNEAPLTYEIAVWMAPAVTMVGFFTLFKKIYETIKFNFFHINKEHILLMGDNEDTVEFIKSLNRENKNLASILLCDLSASIDEEKYKKLLTKVVRLDFSDPENDVNRLLIEDEKLSSTVILVSFEDEPRNYGMIAAFHKMKEWDSKVDIFVKTKDYRIKELIENKMDKLSNFDVHYFNIDELLVKKLLEESTFAFSKPADFDGTMDKLTYKDLQELSRELGTYKLLIVGFSEISEQFLLQAANILTINPIKNLSITVIDNQEARFRNFIKARRNISKVFDYDFINVKDEYYRIKEEVEKYHGEEEYSAVFFGFEDVSRNIISADDLIDILEDVPFAIYSNNLSELDTLIESLRLKHEKITAFGDRSAVLNRPVIIDEDILDKAKVFNAYYNEVMNDLMGWSSDGKTIEEQWMALSNVKKESSAYQAAHRMTKLRVLNQLSKLGEFDDNPIKIVKAWKEQLDGKDVARQVAEIEDNPYMNFMTALEHKRWNNFYYMRDFEYDEVKDESKRKHDCLIDNWTDFLSSRQRDKAIFDFLSTLSLYTEDELNKVE